MKRRGKLISFGLALIVSYSNLVTINAFALEEETGTYENEVIESITAYATEGEGYSYEYDYGKTAEKDIDPLVDTYEYYENGYKYTIYTYASGMTETSSEVYYVLLSEEAGNGTHFYEVVNRDFTVSWVEDELINTSYSYQDGYKISTYTFVSGYEYSETEWVSYDIPLAESFGDDDYHSYEAWNEEGTISTIEDEVVNKETYEKDGYEYTTTEFESGATTSEVSVIQDELDDEGCNYETFIEEESDDEEILEEIIEEKVITESESDEKQELISYEPCSKLFERDEDISEKTFFYDASEKKLYVIGSDNFRKLNYSTDGSIFEWSSYNLNEKVESIAISGITDIYANAFKNFTKLKKVYVNSDLKYMSTYAFIGCNKLNWIYINSKQCTLDVDSWNNLKVMQDNYNSRNWFSSFKVTCFKDESKNSIYTNCINYGIKCETINEEAKTSSISKTDSTSKNSENSVSLIQMIMNRFSSLLNGMYSSKNTSSGDSSERMANVEYIWQMNDNIQAIPLSDGKTWEGYACYVCTAAQMVARKAAYENYNGCYTSSDCLNVVKYITNKFSYDGSFDWPDSMTLNQFKKDGKAMNLTLIKVTNVTEKELIKEIESGKHPEGIMVVGNYGGTSTHAVLVIDYDSKNGFTIIDTGHKYGSLDAHVRDEVNGTSVNGQGLFTHVKFNAITNMKEMSNPYTVTMYYITGVY